MKARSSSHSTLSKYSVVISKSIICSAPPVSLRMPRADVRWPSNQGHIIPCFAALRLSIVSLLREKPTQD